MPNKKTFIRYFWNRLRPFIRVQLEEHGHHLDNWEEAIKKAINAEAKVIRQPIFLTKRGHQPIKSKDIEKNIKTKKLSPPSSTNTSGQAAQSGQTTA